MSKNPDKHSFSSVLSFRPFINHLKKMAGYDNSSFWKHALEQILEQSPELLEPAMDISHADKHQESILYLLHKK